MDLIRFGAKDDKYLLDHLCDITIIRQDILVGKRSIEAEYVNIQMSWAAHRQTSRPEDMAYIYVLSAGPFLYTHAYAL